jgi:hypothetical protein
MHRFMVFQPKLEPPFLDREQRKLVGPDSLSVIGQRRVELPKLQRLLKGETHENQTAPSITLVVRS